jgi:hypothetical protein
MIYCDQPFLYLLVWISGILGGFGIGVCVAVIYFHFFVSNKVSELKNGLSMKNPNNFIKSIEAAASLAKVGLSKESLRKNK